MFGKKAYRSESFKSAKEKKSSFVVVSEGVFRAGLSSKAFHALCILLNQGEQFHPSRNHLAREMNASIGTIDKALSELKAKNIVSISRGRDSNLIYLLNKTSEWRTNSQASASGQTVSRQQGRPIKFKLFRSLRIRQVSKIFTVHKVDTLLEHTNLAQTIGENLATLDTLSRVFTENRPAFHGCLNAYLAHVAAFFQRKDLSLQNALSACHGNDSKALEASLSFLPPSIAEVSYFVQERLEAYGDSASSPALVAVLRRIGAFLHDDGISGNPDDLNDEATAERFRSAAEHFNVGEFQDLIRAGLAEFERCRLSAESEASNVILLPVSLQVSK